MIRREATHDTVKFSYRGLAGTATVIRGDREGNIDEARLSWLLEPYVVDITVMAEGCDITELLSRDTLSEIETEILNTPKEEL